MIILTTAIISHRLDVDLCLLNSTPLCMCAAHFPRKSRSALPRGGCGMMAGYAATCTKYVAMHGGDNGGAMAPSLWHARRGLQEVTAVRTAGACRM